MAKISPKKQVERQACYAVYCQEWEDAGSPPKSSGLFPEFDQWLIDRERQQLAIAQLKEYEKLNGTT